MRDSVFIDFIENDYNRFKAFFKQYIADEGERAFEVWLKVRAIERTLKRIPFVSGMLAEELDNVMREVSRGLDCGHEALVKSVPETPPRGKK